MSENHGRRWRGGAAAGRGPKAESSRVVGRTFFSLVAAVLLGLIIWIFLPSQAPRSWVVTFAGQPLDELTLTIPFAKDDATAWIPKSAVKRHHLIADLDDPGRMTHEIESLRKQTGSRNHSDTLIVYIVGYGINNDDRLNEPQIVVNARRDVKNADIVALVDKDEGNQFQPIPVRALLKSLVGLPFRSILVVFDCSRTLDCPRWGWEATASFEKGLVRVVKDFCGSSEHEILQAEKLWVICASENRQFGISLPSKQRSLFGWAWHQSLKDAVQASKKSSNPMSIGLKDLYEKLSDNIGSMNPPLLFWGGHGSADQNAAAKHSQIVWHGDVEKMESEVEPPKSTGKDPGPDDVAKKEAATKKKELIEKIESAKPEELDGLAEKLRFSPDSRKLADLWRFCEKVESGVITASNPPRKDSDIEQLQSPLIYAPHLWRRLKSQLIADECRLLASPNANVSFSSYENLFQKLKSWPKTEPSISSNTVFDQLNSAWYRYATFKEKSLRPVSNEKKEKDLIEAHRHYANALFLLPELDYLSNRLASVTNAKSMTRNTDAEIETAANLTGFHQLAFPSTNEATDLERRIDSLILLGKKLQEWRERVLAEWAQFGSSSADELMKFEKNSRSNWVTLELLLTSGIWSCEQRQRWRIAQTFVSQAAESRDRSPGDWRGFPNHPGLIELTKRIEAGLKPFPTESAGLPAWYRELARKANDVARQNNCNDAGAHLLAALCDPRDVDVFERPCAVWFEPKLNPQADPEYLSVELIPPEVKATEANPKPEPPQPGPVIIDLDASPGQAGVFRFRICWKRSPDRKSTDRPKVTLKAKFDANWITAAAERELAFDETDPFDEGVYRKIVEWPVTMAQGKSRVNRNESAAIPFTVEFDLESLQRQNGLREPLPRFRVQDGKESVHCLISPQNRRSVSLSLTQLNWSLKKKVQGDFEMFEVPLISGRNASLEWRVKNDSPIGVKVSAQVWAIDRADEWTNPWGRISGDYIRARKSGAIRVPERRLVAEYEIAALNAGEDQIILWNPPAAGAKDGHQIDVTHGLVCRLSADGKSSRESWIEFAPRPPRKWLVANGNLTPGNASESLSVFDVGVAMQESDWPRLAYESPPAPRFKLKTILTVPKGWEGDRVVAEEVPGIVSARFKTVPGANDQQASLKVEDWPRTIRWQVKAYPNAEGKQNISETYRLNFTRIAYPSESESVGPPGGPAVKEPSIKTRDIPIDNTKENPLNFRLGLPKDAASSKVLAWLEADALETSFSDSLGGSDELRVEQLFGDLGPPKTLFRRRADRDWTTQCQVVPDDPGRLVFKAIVSDFDKLPLEIVGLGEKVITLRAAFYAGEAQIPSPADGKNDIHLLLDGSMPSIEIDSFRKDSKTGELIVSPRVSDNRDGVRGSGVNDVRIWLRPYRKLDRPLSAEERSMPTASAEVDGDAPLEIRIPTKQIPPEDKGKLFYIVARARDRVGLESEDFELRVGELRSTDPKKKSDDPKDKPKDGVIQGRVQFPTGKEAGGFTVRLAEHDEQDGETKTSTAGTFHFDKLDRDVEYSLTVKAKSINGKNYGLSQPKKIKPSAPGGIKEESIELIDLSAGKK